MHGCDIILLLPRYICVYFTTYSICNGMDSLKTNGSLKSNGSLKAEKPEKEMLTVVLMEKVTGKKSLGAEKNR